MHRLALLALLLPVTLALPALAQGTHFESPHVHPVELSPDGTLLFTIHTADHRLGIWDVSGPGVPVRLAEVPVGLGPVSVRARTNDEVWVVNHISDDISIVNVTERNVVATLLTGDEPTDVVFAGTPQRAFVCVSQEDRVRVFDPASLGSAPEVVELMASDPRSLAVSNDGSTVWVTALEGGNRTTVVNFADVATHGAPPPSIPMNPELPAPPITALIVRHDGVNWVDETSTSWDTSVTYQLLDNDVLGIDVATRTVVETFGDVGTSMLNVAVSPADGSLWVTNQEALNEVRFEPVLKGQFLRNRVTRIVPGSGTVTPWHLNAHVNYANEAGDALERALSLSIPTDIVVDSGGATAYVAAFGSRKVGVLDGAGNVTRRIDVGEGPSGLALDETGDRLFVLNRHSSSLSVVDLTDDSSVELALGFDPTPANVKQGRIVFYDGENSSSHGDISCASCHLFSHMDNLAWDLGNPAGDMQEPPPAAPGDTLAGFHPMKGPMTTQTLRGIVGTEPFHWRGDKEQLSGFNPAFVGLLGRGTELSGTDFQLMEDFLFSIRMAPNPNRHLDGSLPATLGGENVLDGEETFFTSIASGGGGCFGCHANPSGNDDRVLPEARVQAISNQDVTIPQLRNLYEKTRFTPDDPVSLRGYGTTHNGQNGNVFPHQLTLAGGGIDVGRSQPPPGPDNGAIEAFLLCFDTGTHPVVGAQWTMDGTNEGAGLTRVLTMQSVADFGGAGVIAKGRDGSGDARGWVYAGAGGWDSDRVADGTVPLATLLAQAADGTEITFTGVLFGDEQRLGVDRDGDGFRDRDELDHGSDPTDPGSTPSAVSAPLVAHGSPVMRLVGANPTSTSARIVFAPSGRGRVDLSVYDVTGRQVRSLYRGAVDGAAEQETAWDLRDGSGRRVASGTYFVRLWDVAGTTARRVTVLR
jgi:DNA-binding beta-propeller fold protein YncE